MTTCCTTSSRLPKRWPPKDPRETRVVEFDFSAIGAVVSGQVLSVVAYSSFGVVDESPAAILGGMPYVEGAFVRQQVIGGVDLVDYYVTCEATVDGGDRRVLAGVVPVRNKAP